MEKMTNEFGYPECCIRNFINPERRQFRMAIGFRTGFVPCFNCAYKVYTGEIEGLDKLISGRKYKYPFPIYNVESIKTVYFDSKVARKAYEDNKILIETLLNDNILETIYDNYSKLVPPDWNLDKAIEHSKSTG